MTTAGTPSASSTATPTHQPYKLMRASKGRMLAGVAAGLAKASGLDVTVVRICVGASMLTGLGVIGYILLWIVLPQEQPVRGRLIEPAPENTARIIRITLVVAAVLGALHKVGVFWPFTNAHARTDIGFDGILGLILLSLGAGVLFSRHRPDRGWSDASPPPTPAPTPTTVAAPAPADDDTPAPPASEPSPTPTEEVDTVSFVGPFAGAATEVHAAVTDAVTDAKEKYTERRRVGSALGWARAFGWFVLLWWFVAVIGFVGLWRYGAISVAAPVVLGVACWVVFTAVLNTLIRVRYPSAVIATLFLLAIPGVIGLASVRAEGPVGARTLRPVAAADLDRSYRQAIGNLELDLSAAHLSATHPTDVDAKIGTGALIITIPNNVAVTVNTKIVTGGYDVLEKRTTVGVGQSETLRFKGCEGAPKLRLHVRGGAGWIQVKRANGNAAATCARAA
jgi:phage shock protein PspC (stress-responsive transcriptional regulator)